MSKTGDRGEMLALQYLEGKGFGLVERNYRSRFGEIDLIMRDGEYVVFVEVKMRASSGFGTPLESVTPSKMRKTRMTAELWLAQGKESGLYPRFDVVGIGAPDGAFAPVTIEHIENAF